MFQAKIRHNRAKKVPLTHDGYRGRRTKKGDGFTTSDPNEARYYQHVPGFSVEIVKGKLAARPVPEPEPEELEDEETEGEEEEEDRGELTGAYEVADLKKMSKDDLKALIEDDDDLPLSLDDLPKKASKADMIEAIVEAQSGSEDEDEDEDEEDED